MLQVQILQDVLATGYTVDMLVAPDRVSLVQSALRRAKIPVQIADTNVQRLDKVLFCTIIETVVNRWLLSNV